MMPPAKQMDPVIGVDIHLIQPPGPVPPVPIPHPFVGMILDPLEFVPIIGATVMVNGMPAAIAGAEVRAIPPHIPIGGVFVPPPPGNEGEMFMGSSTVSFDGDAASHMLHPALTCQSIGMPAPPRPNPKKKKGKKATLMLPTSVVLPIPAGAPVLIGGPPTISLMVLGMKAAMFGLGKAFKRLKATKAMKGMSDWLHKKANKLMDKIGIPPSLRNKVHKKICAVTGHPVDVAAGKVFTDHVDLELPGPLPFRLERTWFSTSVYKGPLGHGWHHTYDMKLAEQERVLVVIMEDGRPLKCRSMEEGESLFIRAERLTIFKDDQGYGIRHVSGITYRFTPHNGDKENQLLSSITDRASGTRIVFYYDQRGCLRGIVDSTGRMIRVAFNAKGKMERLFVPVPDPSQQAQEFCAVHYIYDTHGDLVEVRDALNQPFKYEYQNHLLTKETNRNGLSFYFEYDGVDHNARCTRTYGDGGIYNHRLQYDLEQNITVVTNSLGHKTTYYHDGALPHRIVDALGNETLIEYDADHFIVKETDELGRVTERAYDDRGNQIKWTGPDGSVVETEFKDDEPVRAVDPAGNEWTWDYDHRGRLLSRTDPLGRSFAYGYSGGTLTSFTDPAGGITDLEYDNQFNLTALVLPDGTRQEWRCDRLGRMVVSTDPKGNQQKLFYDVLGRITRVEEPDGNLRELAYDRQGNVVRAVDQHYDVGFTYQGMNRLASRTQAGTTVRFAYDTEEQLIAIQNEHRRVYSFELGPTGEVETESGFDGLRRRYIRDEAGRVVRVEKPKQTFSTYEYDLAGRVVGVVHSDGFEETYEYSKDGELIAAENPARKVRFERDALGRVVREFQGRHWVASAYDMLGMRTKMWSSLGAEQEIVRNPLGDVSEVVFGPDEEHRFAFKRDELGLELERSLPGGLDSIWERDKLGRPIKHEISAGMMFMSIRTYKWDVNDRLLEIKDASSGTTLYEHDALGNLASARYENYSSELRMPDAVGNLFKKSDRSDRKYGPAGQLLQSTDKDGTTYYEYDAEGNLVRKIKPGDRVWTYEWNGAGMLSKVYRPDGQTVEFWYDALGRRIKKTFKGKATHWVWDGNNPLHEWTTEYVEGEASGDGIQGEVDEADEIEAERRVKFRRNWTTTLSPPPPALEGTPEKPITWLFEPDTFSPMAKIVGPHYYAIVTDHLGTPTTMLDGYGQKVWSADISIYGKLRNIEGEKQACPFRWPGQYEDAETGLYYNRFRYYDPDAGQYCSQDPIRLYGGSELYAYPLDPLSFYDPLGLITVYRLLRPDEDPSSGLNAKKPGRNMTPHGHVSSGSRNKGSQFISTSTDPEALAKWREPGQRMVSFDTDDVVPDVKGNRNILDISSVDKAKAHGIGGVSARFSANSKEVLVEGHVPPQAIKDCK